MQPVISVIVPVYKAEKYLHRCVDSILSQTFTDFELILIDDGSPDNCGSICDEYSRKDKRITVIHKENGGVTSARATGVKNAKGEYITFVDADDHIFKETLDTLLKGMSTNIDIVIGSYATDGIHKSPIKCDQVMELSEYIPKNIVKSGLHQGPCGKLYRKILFDDKIFDISRTIVYGEDTIMNLRLALKATGNIRITTEEIYFYRDNISSCCNTFSYDLKYLETWYKHLKESIPLELRSKYLQELIKFRFIYYDCVHKHYINNNVWKKTDFHKELLQDIKASGLKLKLVNRISLKCNNPITSWLYLILIQIYKIIKNRT